MVIFPQIFPRSCYRAIKYSPVVTTGFLHFMPRSLCKYKGIWLYPCINYRAIRYCPVVATGHFLLQGYMTVQRAHCAVHHKLHCATQKCKKQRAAWACSCYFPPSCAIFWVMQASNLIPWSPRSSYRKKYCATLLLLCETIFTSSNIRMWMS